MKRILSFILAAGVAVASLSAQETEKKQYLPEEGDWSIGFDAKPVLNFVGNIFNGNTDNKIDPMGGQPTLEGNDKMDNLFEHVPTISIMGKYMLTDELAVKANIGVLVENNKSAQYVQDDAATILDPLSQAKVADYRNTRNTGLSIMAGVEYRVGKKRIQGVFGGGLLFGVSKSLVTYSYGNEMTSINQMPTSGVSTLTGGYRPLKEFGENPNFFAGLVGTAGVEFFVAPKIALGAEVCLMAGYQLSSQRYTISEGYNTSTEVIEKKTDLVTPMTGSFRLATDSLGGSLYLSFYF